MSSSDNSFMPRSFSTRNTMFLSAPNSAVQKQRDLEELDKTKKINEGNFQVTKFISSYLDKLDLVQKTQIKYPSLSNNTTNFFFNMGKQHSTKEHFNGGEIINKFFSSKKKSNINIDNTINLFKSKSKSKFIINNNNNNNSNSNNKVNSFFKSKQHSILQHKKEDNINNNNKEDGSENDIKNFILTRHFSSVVDREKKKKQPTVTFGTCFGTGLGSIGNINNINYQDSSDALLGGIESTLIQNSNSNTKAPFNPSEFLLTKTYSSKKRGNDAFILNKRDKRNGTGGFILNHISCKNNASNNFILNHKTSSFNNNNNSNNNNNNSGFILNHKSNINNKNTETPSLFLKNKNNSRSNGDFILNHRASYGSSFLNNGNSFILNHNNNTNEKSFTLKYNNNNNNNNNNLQYINKKTLPNDNNNNNNDNNSSNVNSFILSNISSNSKTTNNFTLNFRNKCSLSIFNQPHNQQVPSGLELLQRVSSHKSKLSNTQLDTILKKGKDTTINDNNNNNNNESTYIDNAIRKSSKMIFDLSKKNKTRSNKELYNGISLFNKNIKSLHNIKSNKTIESHNNNSKYNDELLNRFKSSHSRTAKRLSLFQYDSNDVEPKSERHKERRKLSIILSDNVNNNKDENDIRNILDLNKNEYKEFNQLCSQLHQNISLRPTSTQNDDNEDDEDTTTHHHQTFNNIINDDKPKDIPQLTLETTAHKFNTNTNTNTNTNETLPTQTQTHKDIIDTHTHTHTHIDDIKILNELKHRYLPSHLSHVYDSLDDEENSDEVKETYYLEPFTSHRFIYDMFLFILEIYSLIFIPYDLAFTLHSPYTLGWKFILNLLIDCMFIIDIILGFFTAFYNNDDVLVIDIPLISINYIKTWFTIDLISGIPLNTLIDVFRYIYPQSPFTTVSSTSFHSNYIILINVLKCLRLVKGIKVFFHNTFSVKVSECVLNRFPSGKGFRLLITLLVFTICIHTFASFLVFIGNAFYPNWIVNYGLEPEHDIEVYIAGIYFVCVSIISVGYGDILCSNLVEKTLALILLTFGLGIYSWAISALSAFYEVDDLKTYEYKVKMDILNDIHSSYKNVTSVLIEKIQRHLLYRLNSDKIDCNAIIQDLPYSLRNAMLFEMYKPIINNFVFFKNFNSLDFIFKVIICLKPVYAVRNEKLINDGELVEETVFVKNGKLSLEFPLPLVFNNETLNSLTRQISFSLSNDVVTYEQTSFIENLLRTGFAGRNVVVPSSSTTTLNGVKSMLMDTQTVNASYLASSAVSSCKKNNFNLKEYTHNQQYVKLIEIRRNEHFGDVLMFLDKKSPLLAKVKTKKAELFLLKKTDAVDIAGEFPDIWKQIVRKSLFNMKQINRLINRSLKFFFIHYEGQNAHDKDKANMKRINTNDNAVGSNSMNTLLKRNANSRNTYIHQTHIDTCIGLLGEDEGDVELESVPDSDDIREEVEMEKMIEEGGIEDNGVGSVDETTKVGSEKRDGINMGGLVLVSKGNESNNGEEVNEGGSDYVNQMGNELQQKMCFLLLKKDNNNNNNVEAVISNKAQSEKSKENENESNNNSNSSNESNSKSNRSNRSNETIKHLNTKDNNNNTNIVNSNTNTKPSVNLQTQAVISTKSSIKEIPKLLHKNNTIINKDLISSSNIDSTFRHKSTVKVSSHNSSYNDIDNYDLIDTESINSEYHSDEYELKKNILYSRTKRSNQPLLPPKNIKPFPKSLNHSKPEHDMLTESFLLKSKHSHNDKLINIKFSKDKFPSIHRKPSLTPTERSNKSGSVQSKDILNVSIGFHSINSSKSNIDLLKEGGSMNFNAPETENNISFIGSNIKLYTTNKINSTIAHSQIVNNSITKMRKRHSISPINKPLLINDMMVSSLKEGDIVSGNSLMIHKPKKKFTDVNIPHDHNNNNNNNSNSNHRKFSKRKSMVLFNKKIEHKTSTKSGACPASSQFEKLKMSPIKKRKDDGMIMFNSPKKKRLCDSCIINKIEPVLLDGQKRKTNTQRRKSMLLLHGDKGFRLAGSFGLSNNQNESKKMERRKSRLDVISSNIANDSLNLNNPEAFYSSMFAKVIDEDKKEKEMKIQKQSDNENENEC